MFHPFSDKHEINQLPSLFTFPFYYEPHPLAMRAAEEVQQYLTNQNDFTHNFGLNKDEDGIVIGKMFGVLVVKNQQDELGYVAAVSGKLADSNEHYFFVAPVFDMLTWDGFFKEEEAYLKKLNQQIEAIEQDSTYLSAKATVKNVELSALDDIANYKERIKIQKQIRQERRKELMVNEATNEAILAEMKVESQQEGIMLKNMKLYWKHKLNEAMEACSVFENQLAAMKAERKSKSALLQQRLFDSYTFLNAKGEAKSIGELFANNPPAGAGECSAPKLLQYAYKNQFTPIAMAEFWWGQSPKSEIRKHKEYYPACIGKCEPILTHMMQGLCVEPNPLHRDNATDKALEIIYEDEAIMVINKPEDLPTVPGKHIADSVYQRIMKLRPALSGPVIVHRLDMATSGVLILAKNKTAYHKLQRQFVQHKVEKEYIAILDGTLTQDYGVIELPLLADYLDRPKQRVDYENGKVAITRWEKEKAYDGITRVRFFPKTGRTHQLRVHAAHKDGLNTPIVGDDLYGRKAQRLLLHAFRLCIKHPLTNESMEFVAEPEF